MHLLVNEAHNRTRYIKVNKRFAVYIKGHHMKMHHYHLTGIRTHLFFATLSVLESEVAYLIVLNKLYCNFVFIIIYS